MDKLMQCSSCVFVIVSSILFISYAAADKGACVRNPGPIAQLCSSSSVTGSTVSVDASLFKDSARTRCSCKVTVSSPEVLVVTTSSPGFMECGTSLELIIADDQKDFGCAMATHTSTRGEGSISIINSTQNILSSDYCVLFQVREGDVTLVCEDQKPNLEMPIAEPNMAITDTGVIDPSSTQSVLTDIVSSNKTILSTTTETNTIMNTTSSSLNNTGAGNNVTAFDNIGNATASELRRLFANTQISEDKMSGFLNKYPDLRELIIEPVTLSDLIDNSTKGLFAEFARESFTDTHGRLQPEVTSPLILLTENQPISTAPPTEQTTQLQTTTIVLDQPVADKNTIMEKYPEINETVFEPVPEGLLDLIKPIEDAILPKTTVTPVDESMSTGKEVKPVTSTVLFSSPISTAASMDGVSSQVSSTNIPDISSNKDVFRSLDLTTSTPVHSKTSTETAVNKSIILEKYSNASNVIIEPVSHEIFNSLQNKSSSVSNTSSTTISDISTADFTTDVPVVNKSAILEKYSNLSNVTFEPVANESSTIFTNESTVETTDIPSVNKSAILEKYSDLTNVTFEPVANESSTIFTNESTVKTTDIPSVNKSAILDKYSDLSNVTFEPVSYESSTIFSNESIAETTDIPSVNKTAIFEKYSDLSNVTFEPVSHESSTTFSNESTAETTDTFTFSRSAIVEKHSNMSDVIIEPVTEETFLLLKNKTTPYFNTTKVTTDPVISGESDIISTTDSPIVDKSTILEKHSNLSGIIIEPATEETLALLQNGTTALPDSLVRTEESLTWKKNISDVMADIPVVNKSSILEKYSNLSDITIEPASYENFTSSKQNQSTTELNTAEVIRDNTTPLLPASGLPNNKSTDLNNLAYPVDSTTESSIENNTSTTTSLGNDTLALTNSSRHFDTVNETGSGFMLDTSAVNALDNITTVSTIVDNLATVENTSGIIDSLNQTSEDQSSLTSGMVQQDQSTPSGTIPLSDESISGSKHSISTISGEQTTTASSIIQDTSTGKTSSNFPPMESLVELSTQETPRESLSEIDNKTGTHYPTEAPVNLVTHMSPKSTEDTSKFPTEAPVKLVTHMSSKSTDHTSQYPTEAPVKLVTHMSPISTEDASQYPTEAPVKLMTHMAPTLTEDTGKFPTEAPVKLVTDMAPRSTLRNTDTSGLEASTKKTLTTSRIISTLRPVSDPITTGSEGIGNPSEEVKGLDITSANTETTSATSEVSTTDSIQNVTNKASANITRGPLRNSTDISSRNKTRGSVDAYGDEEDSFYLNNHTLTIIIIGSVIGVLVIIAIIVIIASFMKSRRRSANITGFEKDGMELNGGGIDNPLVQLEQERQLVETNPNPALNGSMDFTIIPSSSGVNETSQTTQQTSLTNNVNNSSK